MIERARVSWGRAGRAAIRRDEQTHLGQLLSTGRALALLAKHAHLRGAVVADHVIAGADREDRPVPGGRKVLTAEHAGEDRLLIEIGRCGFLSHRACVLVLVVIGRLVVRVVRVVAAAVLVVVVRLLSVRDRRTIVVFVWWLLARVTVRVVVLVGGHG